MSTVKKQIKSVKIILHISIMFFLLSSCSVKVNPKLFYATGIIIDLRSDKSRYAVGEPVKMKINLNNSSFKSDNFELGFKVTHLDQTVYEEVVSLSNKQSSVDFEWLPPLNDFNGYLVHVTIKEGNTIIDQKNIGIDVSSSWRKFPRYGYLADFSLRSVSEINEITYDLNKYHLNALMFYDWQYRHDQPVSGKFDHPDASWLNIANSTVYLETIKEYVKSLHALNMLASNYNLVYGVYEDFASRNISMGLFKDSNQKTQDKHDLPDSWASDLYIVNPMDLLWQSHYIEMENIANDLFSFDLMHLDTLGNRGNLYDSSGKLIDMQVSLAQFTKSIHSEINQGIVFNFVNEYAKNAVTALNVVDISYTEVWPDQYPTYASLKNIIDNDHKKGLSSVLALYMNYPQNNGSFNTPGVLFMEAVVLASGGTVLSLGDLGMLSSEYFPNDKLKMNSELEKRMTEYSDFMVAYENILREDMEEQNANLNLSVAKFSTMPSPKSIWLFSKENAEYKTIQIINLSNRSDLLWRDDNLKVESPEILKNIKLSFSSVSTVKGIYFASPDFAGGTSKKLEYTHNGGIVTVVVPSLEYWSMIYIVK